MNTFQSIFPVIILVIGMAGLIIYFVSNQLKNLKEDLKNGDDNKILMEWLKDMKGSVEKNSDVIERQLNTQRTSLEDQLRQQRDVMSKQTKLIWDRLTEAQNVIGNMSKQIGGIEEFGKDIKDLSNILKSPKLRGGLGEQFLYDILANTIPADLYKAQYEFKGGNKCDAVIFTDKGIIPIDSKFSLENFKGMVIAENQTARDAFKKEFVKDVKKRIDEIASKYILPDEGTTDQALMYIPSESVYYELITNTPQVEEYARHKNVLLTSPNTLSYFLKVLLVAYQQKELQKHANEILKSLAGIKMEAEKFDGDLSVLEKHISNASKAAETVRSKFGKLYGKIENVNMIGSGEDHEKKLLEEAEEVRE